jgi:hypothetical protein
MDFDKKIADGDQEVHSVTHANLSLAARVIHVSQFLSALALETGAHNSFKIPSTPIKINFSISFVFSYLVRHSR